MSSSRRKTSFAPLPWHARWDSARSFLNRAFGDDYPGTLGVQRSALEKTGGYCGAVLFENLELIRTLQAHGLRRRLPRMSSCGDSHPSRDTSGGSASARPMTAEPSQLGKWRSWLSRQPPGGPYTLGGLISSPFQQGPPWASRSLVGAVSAAPRCSLGPSPGGLRHGWLNVPSLPGSHRSRDCEKVRHMPAGD